MIEIDRGDYLTFASIADAVGILSQDVDGPWWKHCETKSGIWRRHPNIGERSRSDISRDGHMGVIFNDLVNKQRWNLIKRIRQAGWSRWWTMGDRGNFDYINIWPLVPILYAAKPGWSWFPTIPTACTKFNNRGFRAHLLALTILIEHLMGKKRWSHRQGAKGIYLKDPKNPWFWELHNLVEGKTPFMKAREYTNWNMEKGAYHWGGCPGEVFKALTIFTAELPR